MKIIPRALALVLILGAGSFALAGVATVPALTGRVVDLTATLTPAQVQATAAMLESLEKAKGSQLAVLIVPTTQPETIEQYGIRVAEQWKLGRKGVDDGAILIVAKSDRTLRIEVGYGLEGVLNDATAKRIVSEIIVPRFRQGDFAGGIHDGVDRMVRVIEGEKLPQPGGSSGQGDTGMGTYALVALLFAVFLGGLLRLVFGRFPAAVVTGGLVGFLAWLVVGAASVAFVCTLVAFFVTLLGGVFVRPMGGLLLGRNRRPGFGGFNRGGGFRGSSSGGGFRGGGGGFGGGGASGRW
ncbi:MAG TPA: TPM domain-containing protein [Steroidobacteraceae bacterium]